MTTIRQHLISQVGHKLGIHNYNAYARENDLPYTAEFQGRVDEHKERFDGNLVCTHVDQMYSTMWENSVESFLMGYIQTTHPSRGYQGYTDKLNERSFKMLMNAIIKEGERVTEIYINAELAKIRQAKKESNS